MRLTDFESVQLNELSPATLASYKIKAGAAATAADAAGDQKTADRRFRGIVKATKKQFDQDAKGMSEGSKDTSGAEDLHVGDPVIITGKGLEFEGATGEISAFGQQNRFVVVNLYNHGPHSFHSSDVSFNEYAGSDEEEARMYDTDPDARAHGVNEQGMAEADLDKFKKYTRPVVKTEPKIERTTNPAGRTTDHVEYKVTTPTGEIHRYKSKKQAQEHFDSFGHQGVSEGKADYNFDIEDLKRLERIRDLPTLKTQAMMLISKPSAKPMRPEKVEWFRNALERMTSPMAVIKLMYDLLLSGEGHAVVGSKSSMNPNSYRQRFNEQDSADDALAGMKRLAGIATVPARTTPGLRQYRHMPTAVQPR